jgi:very-short-patch-repair endonuclease
VGMPDVKVACEVDGWEHHGRFLSDFKRDRERDRALVENGWRVIRFYASEVKADIGVVLECVERVRTMVLRGK